MRGKHFSLRRHFLALCGRVSQPNRACRLHIFAVIILLSCASQSFAGMVTFGSGGNQFQMEFVTIGSPGNAADTTGAPNPAGSVGYVYGIGTYEVSEVMIDKYNASQPGGVLQITSLHSIHLQCPAVTATLVTRAMLLGFESQLLQRLPPSPSQAPWRSSVLALLAWLIAYDARARLSRSRSL